MKRQLLRCSPSDVPSRYMGMYLNESRPLAQDDDDVQAVRQQIRKAWGTWARVGQVLRGENAAPRVAAKFYKAVVQSVLLYGSETWNLTETVLARLEGFHIQAAYRMARKHKSCKGLCGNWIYPSMCVLVLRFQGAVFQLRDTNR